MLEIFQMPARCYTIPMCNNSSLRCPVMRPLSRWKDSHCSVCHIAEKNHPLEWLSSQDVCVCACWYGRWAHVSLCSFQFFPPDWPYLSISRIIFNCLPVCILPGILSIPQELLVNTRVAELCNKALALFLFFLLKGGTAS